GVVFVGTLYPLFVEALTGEKLSVGAPYFNSVAGPLALLLAVLVGIGPLLAWRRARRPIGRRLVVPALLAASALAMTIILAPDMGLLPRLGLTVAAWLAAASVLLLIGRNPFRAPLATWGMVLAHFGVSVALAGMAANAAFTSEKLAVARPGETLAVGPWLVQLQGVDPAAGPNWTAIMAGLLGTRGEGLLTLKPQNLYFADPPTETNEAAIATLWNGQLYTVVGR